MFIQFPQSFMNLFLMSMFTTNAWVNVVSTTLRFRTKSVVSSLAHMNKQPFIMRALHSTNSLPPPPNQIKYRPRTPAQHEYVLALKEQTTKLIIALGPAGTGKSLFACSNAIQALEKKQIEKIILTRPLISVAEEDIGFLPGNLNNKMSIWVQPMMDIFEEHIPKREIVKHINSGVIEVTPLLYMRGRTFKNTIIIADEIQNTTPQQLLMLLTRCGENSKMILTGDLNQSDLKIKNGLQDLVDKIKKSNTNSNPTTMTSIIKMIEFNTGDVQRSELVKEILNLYAPTTATANPVFPVSTNANPSKEYMKNINNCISKIPQEYGDYEYVVQSNNNNDSALIPLRDMKKNKPPNNQGIGPL